MARSGALVALVRGRGGEPVVRRAGAELISPSLALWRVPGGSATRVVAELRARGALRYAERDGRALAREAHWQQGDSLLNDQAELDVIRADLEPPGPGVPVTKSTPASTSRTRSSRDGRAPSS